MKCESCKGYARAEFICIECYREFCDTCAEALGDHCDKCGGQLVDKSICDDI